MAGRARLLTLLPSKECPASLATNGVAVQPYSSEPLWPAILLGAFTANL